MANKVSVITVVYNDREHIRQTMESFFSQTWKEKEYVVIDGGSTDGTVDIIREYAGKLSYWCSEKDHGIYDAMNKGLGHCTGDWVNVLNSGDTYCSERSLEDLLSNLEEHPEADIVYGNAVEVSDNEEKHIEAGEDTHQLADHAIYRHGCSLVRLDVQKRYSYALDKREFGFALDFDSIFRMYHAGCKFMKRPVEVQKYDREGTSNDKRKSILYNYRITTQYGKSPRKALHYIKTKFSIAIKDTRLFQHVRDFIFEYFLNNIVPLIPSWKTRKFILTKLGVHIGKGTFISKDVYFMTPRLFSIGKGSDINRGCIIDARGGLTIGDSVSISHRVNLMTGGHHVNSRTFKGKYLPIQIEDYAWLGVGCTILQGVKIGKGAVVCAGAVVTKDVSPYSIVGGVPARKINERTHDLSYECKWNILYT